LLLTTGAASISLPTKIESISANASIAEPGKSLKDNEERAISLIALSSLLPYCGCVAENASTLHPRDTLLLNFVYPECSGSSGHFGTAKSRLLDTLADFPVQY
jgi:hypothetical protein